MRIKIFSFILLITFGLAACSTPQGQEASSMATEQESAIIMSDDEMTLEDDLMADEHGFEEPESGIDDGSSMADEMSEVDAMASGDEMMSEDDDMSTSDDDQSKMQDTNEPVMDDEMVDLPAWFEIQLSDVNSGETFTINDFRGKVVLVETLAIWCSNCYKQQLQVSDFHNLLADSDELISLGLDIDPNENANDLKNYTKKNGFDWKYAVAPPEMSHDISQLYGDLYLNPPSTPIFLIDKHGAVHLLPFGIKSAQELFDFVQPLLNESM